MQWPYLVLDIPETVSDEDVRKAYQRKVRDCPPEHDAERFSAIQQAYDLVKDAECRARLKLFGLPERPGTLAELIPDASDQRNVIPRDVWLKELNA